MPATLTLVEIHHSSPSAPETAALIADYLQFDRRRTARRHYTKSFGGMAMLVVLGAAFGRVPMDESVIVAGLLLLIPAAFAITEAIHWRRLIRRLGDARFAVQDGRKS